MLAIETKYLGPTDFKGSRIKAYTEYQSIIIPFYNNLSIGDASRLVAEKLCEKLGWTPDKGRAFKGRLIGAGTKNGNVFVFPDSTE